MRPAVAAVTLALGAVLSGCHGSGSSAPSPATADDRVATVAALRAHRALWARVGPASYTYRVRTLCFCTPDFTAPALVTVRDGRKVAVFRTEDGAAVPSDQWDRYPTVDALFAKLQEAVDARAYEVTATYDTAFGHPTTVFIDRDPRIADEEQRYEAGDLRPE